MRIYMFLKTFFRPSSAPIPKTPKEWFKTQLKVNKLEDRLPKLVLDKSKKSVRVYYNHHYLTQDASHAPYSLHRVLTKIPAINVAGDRTGIFQNGLPFPISRDFFARIPLHHPELLSPVERLSAGKKIVFSNSSVFASGGYPHTNPRREKKKPHPVGIFSLAGASFENSYLHYSSFMLDPINFQINPSKFTHLYQDTPTNFKDAQAHLGEFDISPLVKRIYTGLPFLARSASDKFYSSFSRKNAVIFLSSAYFRHQLEDISMLLFSVNEAAKEAGKPAFLKATAVGMGFFAKVNGQYNIQNLLFPYFLRAFKQLLEENSYPWIAKIEFPIFDEVFQEQFSSIMGDMPALPIKVQQQYRDVLEFNDEEVKNYFVCAVNPSDAFAYIGNEWGFSSVEAMIGLNSSLRFDQVPVENPLLLDSDHHFPVRINSKFHAEVIYKKTVSLQPK